MDLMERTRRERNGGEEMDDEGDEQKSKWVTEDVIKGEESRAGNSCRGEEQMVLGGVVTAAVHHHPGHGSHSPTSTGALRLSARPPYFSASAGRKHLCAGRCQTY